MATRKSYISVEMRECVSYVTITHQDRSELKVQGYIVNRDGIRPYSAAAHY